MTRKEKSNEREGRIMTCPDSFHSMEQSCRDFVRRNSSRKKKKKERNVCGLVFNRVRASYRGLCLVQTRNMSPRDVSCMDHCELHAVNVLHSSSLTYVARLSGTRWKWIHQYVNHLSRLIFHRLEAPIMCVNKATWIQLQGYVLNYWKVEKSGIFTSNVKLVQLFLWD